MPLTFASSVFAPPRVDAGLEAFVQINPVTALVDATRALMLGGPVAEILVRALAWMASITAVFAPLAVRRYRRRE